MYFCYFVVRNLEKNTRCPKINLTRIMLKVVTNIIRKMHFTFKFFKRQINEIILGHKISVKITRVGVKILLVLLVVLWF